MEPIIEIKNLTHIYSPNTPFEQRALDQVNLTIYRGEYLGIIGRTGSGKSTLIQHLNGLIRPTEGEVLFQGHDRHHATFVCTDGRRSGKHSLFYAGQRMLE